MEELVDIINRKKKRNEDYYSELLLLEKEDGDRLMKVQVTYMLGVDFLLYGEKEKAFDLQCSAFDQVIKMIYAEKREMPLLSSLIQKIIIEFSKMHGLEVLETFYYKSTISIFKKMVGEFKEVRRVLGDCKSEVFTYLLLVNPKESIKFITREEEVDLLVEALKRDGEYPLEELRLLKGYEKVQALLTIVDPSNDERKGDRILKERLQLCSMVDTEDVEVVVYFWFITGRFQEIVDFPGKISSKVLFIAKSRLNLECKEGEDEYNNVHDGIGSSWDVEGEFIKEKLRVSLRRGEGDERDILHLKDIHLVLEILHILQEEGAFDILKGVLLKGSFSSYSFEIQKVLISFLHLQGVELSVGERLDFLRRVSIPSPPSQRVWLSKVLFNNLLDSYHLEEEVDSFFLHLLLDLSPTPDSITLVLLLLKDDESVLTRIQSYDLTPEATTLLYEHSPSMALDLRVLGDDCLRYLLGVSHGVEKGVVLESHFRGILTKGHLEGIVMNLSLKGTIPLYSFLKSLVVINLKGYLTDKARDVLRMNLKIVEYLKSPEMVLFFRGVLE